MDVIVRVIESTGIICGDNRLDYRFRNDDFLIG
jgi:hypothetical protein